jgi:hypothetical protein
MVNQRIFRIVAPVAIIALLALLMGTDQAAGPAAKLDSQSRAKLLMALLGILLLGLILLVVVVIGANRVRRLARSGLGESRMHEDHWYAKPLAEGQDAAEAGDDPSTGQSGADDHRETEP